MLTKLTYNVYVFIEYIIKNTSNIGIEKFFTFSY